MDDALSEKLCARLTGTMAKKSADNFYKDFLLQNNPICEWACPVVGVPCSG
jgi:hypothetical protein